MIAFSVRRKCLGKNANGRENHFAKAARIRSERASVHGCALVQLGPRYREMLRDLRQPVVVSFTYVGHRLLDTDNLQSVAAAVRDELAAIMGITDAPGDGRARWATVEQRKGEDYALEVRAEEAAATPTPETAK